MFSERRNVKPVYDDIFAETVIDLGTKSREPESRYYYEQWSYDHAVRQLPARERVRIEDMADKLVHRLGKGIGRGTALQILARLGVFFSLNNYEGK